MNKRGFTHTMIATRNLQVVHGRLRLRTRALKGNARKAAALQSILTRQPGVNSVGTNTLTGSVVVAYDTEVTHHHEILRQLGYLGCPVEDDAAATPFGSVTGCLAKAAIELALRALVIGIA